MNDCGCDYVTTVPESSFEIKFCKIHAAAHDMLDALRTARDEAMMLYPRLSGSYQRNMEAVFNKANAAIKKAEGK